MALFIHISHERERKSKKEAEFSLSDTWSLETTNTSADLSCCFFFSPSLSSRTSSLFRLDKHNKFNSCIDFALFHDIMLLWPMFILTSRRVSMTFSDTGSLYVYFRPYKWVCAWSLIAFTRDTGKTRSAILSSSCTFSTFVLFYSPLFFMALTQYRMRIVYQTINQANIVFLSSP